MYRDVEEDRRTYPAPLESCPFCGCVFVTTPLLRTGPYCGRCREADPNRRVKPKPVVIEPGPCLSVMPYRAHDVDAAQERPASLAEVAGRVTLTGAVVLVAVPVAVVTFMAVAACMAAWLLIPHRDREELAG